LKIIANHGAGYDAIDVVTATKKGIWVTNTPNLVSDSTATIAIALLVFVFNFDYSHSP